MQKSIHRRTAMRLLAVACSWLLICAAAATDADAISSSRALGRTLLDKVTGPSNCGKEGTILVNPLKNSGTLFGTSLGMSKDASIIVVGAPTNPGSNSLYPAGRTLSYTQYNGGITCVFDSFFLQNAATSAKWQGGQVATSRDGKLMASVDGFDGAYVNGKLVGNRPVVNLYIQNTTKTWVYLQQLKVQPRRAQISAVAVSFNRDGSGLLVSYSVDDGSLDKVGSAQVFLRVGANNTFMLSQDLASLNHPAGPSYRYGMNSKISPDGSTIAVATAPQANANSRVVYMYRRLVNSGTRYQLVDVVSQGDMVEDAWTGATNYYNALDANIALNPNGNYMAAVQNGVLILYEVKALTSGKGASAKTQLSWQRRCMIAPPTGYRFRGNSQSLSLQQPGVTTAKVSVGAYAGSLAQPTDVLVLTYRISVASGALCPTVPLYSKGHYDSWSQFGAALELSEDGRILAVGAPQAQDFNGNKTVGAVYVYDVSIDTAMPANQFIAQNTNNGIAGCNGGYDANGNPCTNAPQLPKVICKSGYTLLNANGQKIMISKAGEQVFCEDLPTSFFAPSTAPVSSPFVTSTVSSLTTINPSVYGGVGAPVGQTNWAPALNIASLAATGVPAPAPTPKATTTTSSIQQSVQAANGGIPKQSNTISSAAQAQAAAMIGYNLMSVLLGGAAGAKPGGGITTAAGPPTTTVPGLPPGAIITNG